LACIIKIGLNIAIKSAFRGKIALFLTTESKTNQPIFIVHRIREEGCGNHQ